MLASSQPWKYLASGSALLIATRKDRCELYTTQSGGGSACRSPTRKVARPPQRRRPAGPPRPQLEKLHRSFNLLPPTAWGGLGRGAEVPTVSNPKSCAPPAAPAPPGTSAPQLEKLHRSFNLLPPTAWGGLGRGAEVPAVSNPKSCAPPAAPASRGTSAPQLEKLHRSFILLPPTRGEGGGSAYRSPTRKVARPPQRRRPPGPPRPQLEKLHRPAIPSLNSARQKGAAPTAFAIASAPKPLARSGRGADATAKAEGARRNHFFEKKMARLRSGHLRADGHSDSAGRDAWDQRRTGGRGNDAHCFGHATSTLDRACSALPPGQTPNPKSCAPPAVPASRGTSAPPTRKVTREWSRG